ncbi:MAG: aminotransferase class I/II-fold pyridoxal phosphate-dependent enzyme [Oscillospiraceae bacterium]|jgi:aminotransferase|nr:aminotransferase class I/II-fold pyridoxal phosphate-dependent enzyme [Oscillospiraceae bacterium]
MIDYDKILSGSVKSLAPSGIRKFFDILEEMEGAISLGIGEPDFVTPWHIRDAGIHSLEKGFTKYTGNAGLTRLRAEISKYLARRFGLEYRYNDQIIVTVGGSEAIDLAIRALVDPGDEVIIPIPSFVCYGPITTLSKGIPVYIETKDKNEFRLTAEELRAAITSKTKALVLPFPNNPTGAIMERADLDAIADVLRGTNIMVISDEIYAELTYGRHHASIAAIPDMYERTVYVGGFSKSYAMTGWRMGYACGPVDVIRQMLKIHQYAVMSSPTTSQYAAIEAMRAGDGDIASMRREYDQRRRHLLLGLRETGLDCFEPLGAFYMFPSIKCTGLTSEEFCERFLLEKKVAVIPGSAFGSSGEGFIRMCYASSLENISIALERMKEFVDSLRTN